MSRVAHVVKTVVLGAAFGLAANGTAARAGQPALDFDQQDFSIKKIVAEMKAASPAFAPLVMNGDLVRRACYLRSVDDGVCLYACRYGGTYRHALPPGAPRGDLRACPQMIVPADGSGGFSAQSAELTGIIEFFDDSVIPPPLQIAVHAQVRKHCPNLYYDELLVVSRQAAVPGPAETLYQVVIKGDTEDPAGNKYHLELELVRTVPAGNILLRSFRGIDGCY
ncbi:MAG: hypothetical protein ABIJ96_15575 [Elusimicrobiota bacterium]